MNTMFSWLASEVGRWVCALLEHWLYSRACTRRPLLLMLWVSISRRSGWTWWAMQNKLHSTSLCMVMQWQGRAFSGMGKCVEKSSGLLFLVDDVNLWGILKVYWQFIEWKWESTFSGTRSGISVDIGPRGGIRTDELAQIGIPLFIDS